MTRVVNPRHNFWDTCCFLHLIKQRKCCHYRPAPKTVLCTLKKINFAFYFATLLLAGGGVLFLSLETEKKQRLPPCPQNKVVYLKKAITPLPCILQHCFWQGERFSISDNPQGIMAWIVNPRHNSWDTLRFLHLKQGKSSYYRPAPLQCCVPQSKRGLKHRKCSVSKFKVLYFTKRLFQRMAIFNFFLDAKMIFKQQW